MARPERYTVTEARARAAAIEQMVREGRTACIEESERDAATFRAYAELMEKATQQRRSA